MSDSTATESNPAPSTTPNYVGLVRFLVEPFLDSPELLKVDCEISPRRSRVLIRLAFEGEDKGRVFGRGGRNIQAVRAILQAVAQATGYSAHLDVYGSQSSSQEDTPEDKPVPSRNLPRPAPRPRTNG